MPAFQDDIEVLSETPDYFTISKGGGPPIIVPKAGLGGMGAGPAIAQAGGAGGMSGGGAGMGGAGGMGGSVDAPALASAPGAPPASSEAAAPDPQWGGTIGAPEAGPQMAMQGAVYIPPTMQTTGRVLETSGRDINVEPELAATRQAQREEIQAVRAQAKIGAEHADAASREMLDGIKGQQAKDDARAMHEADAIKRVNEKRARMEALEAEHAGMTVDPDRIWANAGTGGKIAAGLGILLGGLGSGLAGGENPAMAVIQRAIDRDIDAQKENIRNKGDAANQARGSLQVTRSIADDEREAELMQREMSWQNVQRKLAAMAEQYKGTALEPQANQAAAQVKGEYAKVAADLKALQAQQVRTSVQNSLVGGGVVGGGPAITTDKDTGLTTTTGGEMLAPGGSRIADANLWQAATKDQRADALARLQAFEKAQAGIEELTKIRQDAGHEWLEGSAPSVKFNQRMDALIIDIAKAQDPEGVVRNEDVLRLKEAYGGDLQQTYTPGHDPVMNKLEAAMGTTRTALEAGIRGVGLEPASRAPVPTGAQRGAR